MIRDGTFRGAILDEAAASRVEGLPLSKRTEESVEVAVPRCDFREKEVPCLFVRSTS